MKYVMMLMLVMMCGCSAPNTAMREQPARPVEPPQAAPTPAPMKNVLGGPITAPPAPSMSDGTAPYPGAPVPSLPLAPPPPSAIDPRIPHQGPMAQQQAIVPLPPAK